MKRYSRQFVKADDMIRIGDREIPPSKLDTEFFTIYWYSFKSEMSDGWHIDGRIVAKKWLPDSKERFCRNAGSNRGSQERLLYPGRYG